MVGLKFYLAEQQLFAKIPLVKCMLYFIGWTLKCRLSHVKNNKKAMGDGFLKLKGFQSPLADF